MDLDGIEFRAVLPEDVAGDDGNWSASAFTGFLETACEPGVESEDSSR